MSVEEARTAQRELEVIAEKYGMGRQVPEGDGWSWEFQPDKYHMKGLREAFNLGLREASRIADSKCDELHKLREYTISYVLATRFQFACDKVNEVRSAIRERAREMEG